MRQPLLTHTLQCQQRVYRRPSRPLWQPGMLTLALLAAAPVQAQTPPDAGRLLQQQTPALERPASSPRFELLAPPAGIASPGGARVRLQGVRISGNSLFSEAELLVVLGEVMGQSYDLAGLQQLAGRINAHYSAAGYPFARALIPAQRMSDGVLQLQVVEGRYGQVSAQGEGRLGDQARDFLAALQPGTLIESSSLERATLILDDQPGIKTTPIIRPGQTLGSGDLQVQLEREPLLSGEVGLDNHGNRYSGEHRGFFNLRAGSPFMLGDQISLRSLYTEENMWYGNLDYSLPLGGSGLRARVGYAHTYYELGKQFANLDARGTAKVSSAGLSYPLLRSQQANLSLAAAYQHKRLRDEYRATDTRQDKSSHSLPISLQFDLRDGLGAGGITFGSLAWTPGELHLDRDLRAADRLSARSEGHFDKFNLDLARLQTLPGGFTLYGRFSAQLAGENLDSSEDFGLGGPNGVRAYPVGEGYGDEGWLTQLELRHTIGAFSPFVFHDSGRVRLAHRPWQAGDNHRSLSGAGFGVRLDQGPWLAEATVAWRTAGGESESDSRNRVPTTWLSALYRF